MKIGLYGYEGAGASTLFNALTGQEVPTGFGGGKPKTHIGTVKVPDRRIDRLSALYTPKKTIFAELVFSDFPAAGKDAGRGKALANISEAKAMDLLALVVGAFHHDWMDQAPDPTVELENLLTELILTDLDQVERFMERQRKVKGTDPFLLSAMEKMQPHLEEGLSLRTLELTPEELQHIRGFSFLSIKPAIVAVNVDEEKYGQPVPETLLAVARSHGVEPFILSAAVEEEIAKLSQEDQAMFLEDLGIEEPISGRFIRAAYNLANLISFFTVGPDEVRSWTIPKGTKAKQAAGTIHSDLEKGFIRAEVFTYDDILAVGGKEAELKKQGKLRLEGKEYPVKDGDILHIRFNV